MENGVMLERTSICVVEFRAIHNYVNMRTEINPSIGEGSVSMLDMPRRYCELVWNVRAIASNKKKVAIFKYGIDLLVESQERVTPISCYTALGVDGVVRISGALRLKIGHFLDRLAHTLPLFVFSFIQKGAVMRGGLA
jgi:hypothetical protein